MSAYRPRRTFQSAVNAPVVAHVTGVKSIEKSRAEAILSKFISTSEAISTTIPGGDESVAFSNTGMSNNAGSNPVMGQLKRVQRNLRGLPPLLAELTETTGKMTKFEDESEQPKNKKIKFDDLSEDAEMEDSPEEAVDEEVVEEEVVEEVVEEEAVEEESAQEEAEVEEDVQAVVQEEVQEEEVEKKHKKDKKKKEKKEKKEKKQKKEKKKD